MRNTIAACHAKGHAHAQQMHGALMRRNLEKDKRLRLQEKLAKIRVGLERTHGFSYRGNVGH